jgi:hypothetical protein
MMDQGACFHIQVMNDVKVLKDFKKAGPGNRLPELGYT